MDPIIVTAPDRGTRCGRTPPRQYPFDALDVGDHFLVKVERKPVCVIQSNLAGAIKNYQQTKNLHARFKTSKVTDPGYVRVTRTA